ncbi:helix-turn-helix domain-containing protein [Aquamicrobium terrae]
MSVTSIKGWRRRLVDEIEKATRPRDSKDKSDTRPSMRQASTAAKVGPNYISQLVAGQETDARIEKLIAICEVLDIDVLHVLTGVRWDPEIQEAVAAFSALKQHDPEAWADFRKLLGRFQQRVLDEVDSNMEAASQRVRKSDRAQQ